jgi:arginine N-succinyltransferase
MLVRPVKKNDLDAVEALALQAGPGMTNLPAIPAVLADKIQQSRQNFHPDFIDVEKGLYFFILEDVKTHQVVGCSSIAGRANNENPVYHFKIVTEVLRSEQLKFTREHQLLYMVNDYQHTTEVCSLFVAPNYRHSHNGTLISRARFLFMSEYPNRFSHKVIAELRGYSEGAIEPPFWSGLAKHFLPIDFSHTDQLTGSGHKHFIQDLLPHVPIFTALLTPETQAAMGKIKAETVPAYNLLRKEGFDFNNYIDIFDGGPALESYFPNIVTIKKNQRIPVSKIIEKTESTTLRLVANTNLDFRCCQASVDLIDENQVNIDKNTAELLRVKVGDPIRFIALHL